METGKSKKIDNNRNIGSHRTTLTNKAVHARSAIKVTKESAASKRLEEKALVKTRGRDYIKGSNTQAQVGNYWV